MPGHTADRRIKMDQYRLQDGLNTKELETLSANTEDPLLHTNDSSQTNSLGKDSNSTDSDFNEKKKKCGCPCCLTAGIFLVAFGLFLLWYPPYDVLMTERLRMLPGLPAFEWWKDTPETLLLKAFLFNYTNSEAFLNGTDDKFQLEEIGPIVYREKLRHKNVTFNNNGTLSFIANRTAIYLPELNTIDLNATIIVPNFAVLGMASFLHDSSFWTKVGFNIMYRTVKSPIFVKTTIYNYLWNLTDPMLNAGQTLYPSLVPFLNMGGLERIYENFEDLATVYIGLENGHEKFSLMDKYHGSPYVIPDNERCVTDVVVNSTEGIIYPQYNTKKTVLRYWRKTLCRIIPLYYERTFPDFSVYGVEAYKYTMQKDAYNRRENLSIDCYAGEPTLMDGLSDVSMCYDNIPMAASFPHFLYADEKLKNSFTGLKPNKTKHESYVILEPKTGIPMIAFARSQSNLIVRKLSGFHPLVSKFSDMALPMFWLEYHQVGIPDYVANLMYFTVKTLPAYQYYFISFILTLGSVILVFKLKKYVTFNKSTKINYKHNRSMQFEKETFLKKANILK